MSSLQNKRAIVTGGAKGIGKAVVHRLQHEGASVLALDIVEPEYDVEFRKCDVRSEQALEEISANETRVDILVNNAGVYLRAAVVETSGEDLDRIIDTNLKGPYLCCKHFLPVVSPGGCVINIASGLGLVPEPESPAYCSTKAGLVMLTKCLAQEYAPKGIRVNAVLPGPIDTPMLRSSLTSEEELEEYRKANPMRRIGEDSDVANVIAFLASAEAKYVTGGLYSVDGGESTSSIYSKC